MILIHGDRSQDSNAHRRGSSRREKSSGGSDVLSDRLGANHTAVKIQAEHFFVYAIAQYKVFKKSS